MTRIELLPNGFAPPEAPGGRAETGVGPLPPGFGLTGARDVRADGPPEASEGRWERAGDLAAHAERVWIELIAGPEGPARGALVRKAVALRAEVAGPEPSPIESLLAARVVATWLQVHHADASYAEYKGNSIRVAEFMQKRMGASQRRHLAAIGALVAVRKLLPAAGSDGRGRRDAPRALTLVDAEGEAKKVV